MESVKVLETNRLVLRWLTEDDASFLRELMNDPSWIEFIGDRGVRTTAQAREYLTEHYLSSYRHHGFGLYRVERKTDGDPVGICGLLRRESLSDVDLGFALLPEHRRKGFAFEAAAATVEYARSVLTLPRLVAITVPHNDSSIQLLEKLGMAFERELDDRGERLHLYSIDLTHAATPSEPKLR